MERPLPDDVARPARAYLAALVPPEELSDAWHELVDDVAYWGDRDLLPVLRLAHQVALQHERVAAEVAALALVETGVEDPRDVGVVLGADEDAAREWTRTALAARDGDDAPPTRRFDDVGGSAPAAAADPEPAPATPEATPRPQPTGAAATERPATGTTPSEPSEPSTGAAGRGPAEPAMRIGFDDDGPLPPDYGDGEPRWTTRRILVAALVLWLLVVVVWLLVS